MPAIGERLREARGRRGASIEDAEQATKIRARYLRALEDERFDVLPGRTFTRTFLRSYAELLDLDARLLVEEYRAQYEGDRGDEFESRSFSPVGGQGRDRTRGVPNPVPGLGPLAFLGFGALAVILFFLVLGLATGDPEPAPRAPTSAQQSERSKDERPKRRRKRKAAPKSVSLRVTPTEPTYVCVDRGAGKTVYEGTLTRARRFKGNRLRVNLGRTSVRMTSNGRRVPVNRRSPNPVAYDFRPASRKSIPLSQAPCA